MIIDIRKNIARVMEVTDASVNEIEKQVNYVVSYFSIQQEAEKMKLAKVIVP